jgi:hypothetical protein
MRDNSIEMNSESAAERYAAGRMAESEEQAFEVRMLEDPKLAAEVEAIQGLRVGFRVLDEKGEFASWPSRRPRTGDYALAALLALMIIGAGVFMLSRRGDESALPVMASSLSGLGIKGSDLTAPRSIQLAHARGEESPTELTLGGAPPVIALKVLPAVAGDSSGYRVRLERIAGDPPAAAGVAAEVHAQADQSGFVTLYVNTSRLTAGTYRLSLAQGAGSEQFLLRFAAAS